MNTEQATLKEMDITMLFPSPTNPRKHFNEAKLTELANSIKIHGVQQPILVRHYPEMKGLVTDEQGVPYEGEYEVVTGERRYRASIIAEKKSIPALIRVMTDEQVMEIQSIENLQREDVHMVDQAEAFDLWITIWMKADPARTLELAYDALATRIGKTKTFIARALTLLNLVEEAKQLFADDKITLNHAAHLSRLTANDQKECIKYLKQNKEASVNDLIYYIQNNVIRNLKQAPFSPTDPLLNPEAGACVTCPKRSGANATLFGDIQNKDICFDGQCYGSKVIAFTESKIKEWEAAGEEFKIIASTYYQSKVLPPFLNKIFLGKFEQVHNKKCAYAIKAIYGSDHSAGQIINICYNPECKEHLGWRSSSSSSGNGSGRSLPEDPKKKYDIKIKRGRELDIEKVYKRAQEPLKEEKKFVEEITKSKLTKIEKALMLWSFFSLERSYKTSSVLERRFPKLKAKISVAEKHQDPEKFIKVWLDFTEEEQAQLFRAIFIGNFSDAGIQYDYDSSMAIYLFAREHGVPVEQFEKEQAEIAKKREFRANLLMEKEKKERAGSKKKKAAAKNKAVA